MRGTRRAVVASVVVAAGVLPAMAADETAALLPLTPAARWTFGLRLDEGFDTNVRFDAVPQDSMIHRAAAALAHERRTPRRTLAASAHGSAALYSARGLDGSTYGSALAVTQMLGPGATLSFRAAADRAYASDLGALTSEGLVFAPVIVRAYSGAASATMRAAARLTLGSEVRWQRMSFERRQTSPPLVDGTMAAASAFVSSRVAPRDNLVATYELARSDGSVRTADIQTATLGWNRTIATRLTASVAAGATRFGGEGGASPAITPAARASVTVNGRRSALDLRYARGVDHAFGLGRHRLSDVAGVRYSFLAAERLRASATAAYGITRLPEEEGTNSHAVVAGTEVARAIGRGIDVVGSYAFRWRSELGAIPMARGHAVSVSFSCSREWRP